MQDLSGYTLENSIFPRERTNDLNLLLMVNTCYLEGNLYRSCLIIEQKHGRYNSEISYEHAINIRLGNTKFKYIRNSRKIDAMNQRISKQVTTSLRFLRDTFTLKEIPLSRAARTAEQLYKDGQREFA